MFLGISNADKIELFTATCLCLQTLSTTQAMFCLDFQLHFTEPLTPFAHWWLTCKQSLHSISSLLLPPQHNCKHCVRMLKKVIASMSAQKLFIEQVSVGEGDMTHLSIAVLS